MTANPDGVRLLALADEIGALVLKDWDPDLANLLSRVEAALRAAPVPQRDAEPVAKWDNRPACSFPEMAAAPSRLDVEPTRTTETIAAAVWNMKPDDAVRFILSNYDVLPKNDPPALPAGEEVRRGELIAANYEATASVGLPILCSQGGIPYNKPYLDYWKDRAIRAEKALRALSPSSNGKPAT